MSGNLEEIENIFSFDEEKFLSFLRKRFNIDEKINLDDPSKETCLKEVNGYYDLKKLNLGIVVDDKLIVEDSNFSEETKLNNIRYEYRVDYFKIVGWKVILKKDPDHTFFTEVIKNWNWITKGFKHNNRIHRGHYIAHSFKKYLVENENNYTKKEIRRINDFFGKGNEENISYQTYKANCSQKDCRGQLYFENKILKILDECSSSNIFYQIEEIFVNHEGSYTTLGRLLLFRKIEEKEWSEIVFIPNKKKDCK